jgi:hypothetical protein
VTEYLIRCRRNGPAPSLMLMRCMDSEDAARKEAQSFITIYGYRQAELWQGETLVQVFALS